MHLDPWHRRESPTQSARQETPNFGDILFPHLVDADISSAEIGNLDAFRRRPSAGSACFNWVLDEGLFPEAGPRFKV